MRAGEKVLETGWKYKGQMKTENIYATAYSALGIDWRKEITNTPSKRVYRYVDPLGATEFCMDDEIATSVCLTMTCMFACTSNCVR